MKQDIRDLFKGEEEQKALPINHKAEFLKKLEIQNSKKRPAFSWIKIASVVLIALTIGYGIFSTKTEAPKTAPIVAQIEAVEAEYLQDIQEEWESFIAIADDPALVRRFKTKLKDLDSDYKEISSQFKDDTNNILVIEALVENLQTRLQILKDIQAHIKILNQNNEQYENTI